MAAFHSRTRRGTVPQAERGAIDPDFGVALQRPFRVGSTRCMPAMRCRRIDLGHAAGSLARH
ncbi:MAG TPA: hypothetical protein VFN13_12640 [Rudaea sp.]|nr:hypothetical protein [Rudaea sp.]